MVPRGRWSPRKVRLRRSSFSDSQQLNDGIVGFHWQSDTETMMMIMKRRYLVLIAVTFCARLAAASAKVDLVANPASTLAGLSVTLQARVVTGEQRMTLSPLVRIRVTPWLSEPFLAKWGNGKDYDRFDLVNESDLIIPPHTTKNLFVAPRDFGSASWAVDERVTTPGRYQIEMLLYSPDDLTTADVTTSPVVLEVRSPSSRDAEILRAVLSGKLGAPLAEEVLARAPESPYMPYLFGFLFRGTGVERIALFRRIVNLHPNSPMTPRVRLWIASLYESESRASFDVGHDLEEAVRLAELERETLDSVARGTNEWARAKALRRLDDGIPNRAAYIELQRRQQK